VQHEHPVHLVFFEQVDVLKMFQNYKMLVTVPSLNFFELSLN
jgi:hypothetical protein